MLLLTSTARETLALFCGNISRDPPTWSVFTGGTHETYSHLFFVSADLEGMMIACMQHDPCTKAKECVSAASGSSASSS